MWYWEVHGGNRVGSPSRKMGFGEVDGGNGWVALSVKMEVAVVLGGNGGKGVGSPVRKLWVWEVSVATGG